MKPVTNRAHRTRKAYSLLELIVVMVVLGLIAAIAIPTISSVVENHRQDSLETTALDLGRKAVGLSGFELRQPNSIDMSYAAADLPKDYIVNPSNTPGEYRISRGVKSDGSERVVYLTIDPNGKNIRVSSTSKTGVVYGGDELQAPLTSPNLLNGPGYETTVPNTELVGYFTPGGITPTEPGRSGTRAANQVTLATVVSPTGALRPQGIIHLSPAAVNYPTGTKIVGTTWVQGTPGTKVNISYRAAATSGTSVREGLANKQVTLTSTWQKVELAATVTENGYHRYGLQVVQVTPQANINIRMDDSTLRIVSS